MEGDKYEKNMLSIQSNKFFYTLPYCATPKYTSTVILN